MTHENESDNSSIFHNDDSVLREAAAKVVQERKATGLDGLVGGLACVIISTETDRLVSAAQELQHYTGYQLTCAFEDDLFRVAVMSLKGSADILIRSRKGIENPFADFNQSPNCRHLPNTRLETFVFEVTDLDRYVKIQHSRGINFLTDEVINTDNYRFIQTPPSQYTNNSIGFIQWTGIPGRYKSALNKEVDWCLDVPRLKCAENIGFLDHVATRVTAENRDPAILEFMNLTNYEFAFAIYIETLNSITNVARLTKNDFALVFTSGISAPTDSDFIGPTEEFVINNGPRVHHLAFVTENIDDTYEELCADGLDFLSELIGSPESGIKQVFSNPSENTFLVNEYIHRYGDFAGFFTKDNVSRLTESTRKQ